MSDWEGPIAPAFDPKELIEGLAAAAQAGIVCCVADDSEFAEESFEFAARGTSADLLRHEWECEGVIIREGDGVLLSFHAGPECGTELHLSNLAEAIRTLCEVRAWHRERARKAQRVGR